MTQVLLIGGAGFLGLNLAKALLSEGFQVSILDRPGAKRPTDSTFSSLAFHGVPLAETDRIGYVIRASRVDVVIHLASSLLPSSPPDQFSREVVEVVEPSLRLFRELANLGVALVYFSSGGTVYGRSEAEAVSEGAALAPISHYGFAKVMLEEGIRFLHRTMGLNYLVLRPSNPYGPFQSLQGPQGFVSVALRKALVGEPLEIWGDGSVVRDYVAVEDVAQAVCGLLQQELLADTLNLGSGIGHSLREVIQEVESITGQKLKVVFKPARAIDCPRVVLDVSALKRRIDFVPTPLAQGLSDYRRWLGTRHGL